MPTSYHLKAKAALFTYYLPDMTLPELLTKLDDQLDGKFWTVNKETCPETGTSHYHLYVHSNTQMDHDLNPMWLVDGVLPDCNPNTTTGSGYMKAVCRGHFYVECRHKIDHITQLSNFPWEKYPVPVCANWIISLWKQHKIRSDRANECLNFYRSATKYWLDVVNLALQYERSQQQAIATEERQAQVAKLARPFKTYRIVTDWQYQYTVALMRYSFLLISGPTRLGKTTYAASLYPDAFVHNDSIDWTGYHAAKHTAVIFEDIPQWFDYVAKNKVLFQASKCVKVHTSATNCYAMEVDLTAKPLIILTNEPIPDYHDMYDYLKQNSFHLHITEPTWID